MGRNELLYHARLRLRWSQEKAAEKAKISRKTSIELETGKRTPQPTARRTEYSGCT